MKNQILTIKEAADLLGVSTKTLRRWEAKGVLVPRRTFGNQRRYSLEEVENFKKQGRPQPAAPFQAPVTTGFEANVQVSQPAVTTPVFTQNTIQFQQPVPVSQQPAPYYPQTNFSQPTPSPKEDRKEWEEFRKKLNSKNYLTLTPRSKKMLLAFSAGLLQVCRGAAAAAIALIRGLQSAVSSVSLRVNYFAVNLVILFTALITGFVFMALIFIAPSSPVSKPIISKVKSVKIPAFLSAVLSSKNSEDLTAANRMPSREQLRAVLGTSNRQTINLFNVNIPSIFRGKVNILNSLDIRDSASIAGALRVQGIASLSGGINTNNRDINAGSGKITASNILYSIIAGQNIAISGDAQSPVISAAGVTSLQGQSGSIEFTEGDDIQIEGLKISDISTLATVYARGGCDGCLTDEDVDEVLTLTGDSVISGNAIKSGLIKIDFGGTGGTTPEEARFNLGAAKSGANSDITSLSGLTTALSVGQGGTGTTSALLNGVLYGNGPNPYLSTAPPGSGQLLLGSSLGIPTFATASGDLSFNGEGVATISADAVELGTDTTGNYQLGTTPGSGISVAGVAGEGWTPTISLGVLTQDWNQTGAFDIILNSADSELTLADMNGVRYGTLDVAPLGGDKTYIFPDFDADSAYICLSSGNCEGQGGTITGSGITNYLVKFSSGSSIEISSLYENNGNIGFGTVEPLSKIHVSGTTNNQALVTLDETGTQDILTASSSGQTRFTIAANGNIAATGAISGLTGISSSGTINFSGLASGIVRSNAGNLEIGTVDLDVVAGEVTGTLPVQNGGTGLQVVAGNGVLYGNGTDALQVTAAGTPGQILLANGASAPTFTTMTGDVTIDSSGNTTIGLNSVAIGDDTTGTFVASLTPGSGISVGGVAGEAWSPTVSLGALTGNWNQTGAFDILLNNSDSELVMLGADGVRTAMLDIASLTGNNKTYTLPNIPGADTADICLSIGNCATFGVVGSGSQYYVARFKSNGEIENSSIYDNGKVGIGTTGPEGLLHVQGDPGGKALTVLNYTGADQNILTASSSGVTVFNLDKDGNTSQYTQADMRLYDGDNSHYTGFQAPADLTANRLLTLPENAGGSGYMLMTNGSGVLSWDDINANGKAGPWDMTGNRYIYPDLTTYQVGIGTTAMADIFSQFYVTRDPAEEPLGKALVVFNQTEDQDILVASASGTPVFRISRNGDVDTEGTIAAGTGNAFSVATNGDVTAGTFNGQTISGTASFTGTVNVTTSLTSPLYTGAGAVTLSSGGGSALTLDSNSGTVVISDTLQILGTINSGNNAITIDSGNANQITLGAGDVLGNGTWSIDGAGAITASITETINGIDISAGTVSDVANLTINAGGDLTIGTKGLNDTGSDNTTSGATLIGVNDEFTYSNGLQVQQVLKDFDTQLGTASSKWTDAGEFTYLTATGDDLVVGDTTVANASLYLDESTASLYLGTNNTLNGRLTLYSAGSSVADPSIAANNTGDLILSPGNNIGIGTNNPTARFHLTGAVPGKALAILDETGDQDILAASASGTTVFRLSHTGNVDTEGTLTAGTGNAFSVATSGNVTAGMYNSQTISNAANFTGTVAVNTSVSSPLYTGAGAVTLSSGGGSDLTLDSSSGTVLIPDAIQIAGNISSNNGTITIDSGSANQITLGASDALGNGTWSITGPGVISASTAETINGIDISAGTVADVVNLTINAGGDLTIGTKGLNDTGANNTASGATLIGVYDEFTYSSGTQVQEVLKDLDSALGTASSKWTHSGTFTYLTATTDDLVLGANNVAGAALYLDVTDGGAPATSTLYVGTNESKNGKVTLYSSGAGITDPYLTSDNLGNLLIASNNLNVTTTGINNTAIGATTPASAAFTTLSSTGATTIGNNTSTVAIDSSNWNISDTGVASGLTGLTSSGTITFSGLAADRFVKTTTGGQLTTSQYVALGSEVSGTLGVTNGGTGIDASAAGNGKLLIGNGTGYTLANLTAGDGIAITNGSGSIELDTKLLDAQDSEGVTNSRSGLEFGDTGNNELTLLQGCSDANILKWSETNHRWECSADQGGGAGSSKWTEGTGILYPNNITYDLSIGNSTLDAAFSVDVDQNTIRVGNGSSVNGQMAMYASDDDTGTLSYNTDDQFQFTGGDVKVDQLLVLTSDGAAGAGISGGGLSDCDGAAQKLIWDAATNEFGCGTDEGSGGGSSKWTTTGAGLRTYLTDNASDLIVGAGDTETAPFFFDVSANLLRIGDGANDGNTPTLKFYASDGSNDGSLLYTDSDQFQFSGGNVLVDQSLTVDTDTLSVDAANNRVGVGIAAPVTKLHVYGAETGKALAIFDERGDQAILTASASGTPVFTVGRTGNLTLHQNSQINTSGTLLLDSTGTLSLNTTNNQAINTGTGAVGINGNTTFAAGRTISQAASGGQVTFTGNVDATNGLDVTGANLTVGSNFSVAPATGNTAITGSGTLGVAGLITASGGVSIAANQNLTLASGTGTITQNYSNTTGSATTLNVTNSANSGTNTVNALNVALTGTANAGGANTNNAINLANVASPANNTFNAINIGSGYTNLLAYTSGAFTGKLQTQALTGDRTYVLPDYSGASAQICLSTNNCTYISDFDVSAESGPTQTISSNETLNFAAGTGINTVASASDIVTISVEDDSLDYTQLKDTLALDSATVINQGNYGITQNYGSSGTAQTIALSSTGTALNLTSSSTGILANLTASGNGTTATALSIANTAAGVITTAIDVSDPDIATALALGLNDITVNGITLTAAELSLLDGKSGTLLDTANIASYATTGVTAGNGLTGGGTVGLVTLNVAAGTGIVVNADDIAIDTTVVPRKNIAETITGGWTFNTAATNFTTVINANGGITTTAGGLSLNSTTGTTTVDDNLVVTGTIDGLTVDAGTISSGTWQGTVVGSQWGGTGADLSAAAKGSIPYFSSAGVMSALAPNTAGYVLSTNGANQNPTWIDGAPLGYWVMNGGTIYPKASGVVDLLLGGSATASAKFAFVNVNSGTPVASISAQAAPWKALSLSADGVIQTVRNHDITIGGDTTGNMTLKPLNGSGVINFDVAATNGLQINGTNGASTAVNACVTTSNGIVTGTGVCQTGLEPWLENNGTLYERLITQDVLVGGQATTSAKFAILNMASGNPTASISAQNALNAAVFIDSTGTIGTTAKNALTIGGSTTGTIMINSGANLLQLADPTIQLTFTNPTLSATGSNTLNFQTGSTGNVTFFTDKAILTNAGDLDVAGTLTSGTADAFSVNANGTVTIAANQSYAGAGAVTLSSGNSQGLTLDSASNTLTIAATDTVLSATGLGTINTATSLTLGNATSLSTSLTSMGVGNGFTINSGTYVRIGDTGTPGSANGDDDLYVEGDLEVDGTLYADGGIDTSFAQGSVIFAGANGVLTQNNANFFWDNSGNQLGIGTTSPRAKLDIAGSASTSGTFVFRGTTNPKIDILNGENFGIRTSVGGDVGLSERFTILNNGNVGVNNNNPTYQLDIAGTVRSTGLITAAGSLTIPSGQNLQLDAAGYKVKNAVLFSSEAAGYISAVATTASDNLCLLSAATGVPSWGSCPGEGGGSTLWRQSLGAISPINDTVDVLFGNTATASAKFAFTNINTGIPTASMSAGGASGLYLNASGKIATLAKQPLTLGDSTTGQLILGMSGFGAAGVLHNSASGVISSTTVKLDTEVANILGTNNGGTGSSVSGAGGVAGSIPFIDATNVFDYTTGGAGELGKCLVSGGAGSPVWQDCNSAIGNPWEIGSGEIHTRNTTIDLLLGGAATSSARFAVIGMNTGNTPTASLSAGVTGGAYLTAGGLLATTAKQTLTLGNTTTGNIVMNGANVGIADTTPDAKLEVLGTSEQLRLTYTDNSVDARFSVSSDGDLTLDMLGGGTAEQLILANADVINIGGSGSNDVAYNVIGDSTTGASANMNSDDDLYIEGNLEVDGTIYGNVTGDVSGGTVTPSGFTLGSVVFAGTAGVLSQDNANFFWNDTSNKLGINTAANPLYALDVVAPGSENIVAQLKSSAQTAGLRLMGSDNHFWDYQAGGGDYRVEYEDSPLFTVNSTGSVGIGTTNMGAKLDVVGNVLIRDAESATKAYRFSNGGSQLDFEAGGADMYISNWSNANFSGTEYNYLQLDSGQHVVNAQGKWMFRDGNTAMAGNQLLTIDGPGSSGVVVNEDALSTINFRVEGDTDANLLYTQSSTDRVGIGTNAPLAKLDVRGTNYAIPVASVSGATGKATLVVDQSGVGDIFTASSSGMTRFTVKQTGAVIIGTTTNGVTFDPAATDPVLYAGSARPLKQIVLSPEFAGAVLTASGSANTDGLMTSDASNSAALGFKTYYQWSSDQSSLQDYTVAVRVTLPQDFGGWQSSNPVQIYYNTGNTSTANNKLDIVMYQGTSAVPVYQHRSKVAGTPGTWTFDATNASTDLQGSTRWDTAGQTATIYLKMYARNNYYVQIGDIVLNYYGRF